MGEGGTFSSQSDNTSQGSRKEERVWMWSPEDCDMQVVGLGKHDQKDDFMTLSLSFKFEENSMMVIVRRSPYKWTLL